MVRVHGNVKFNLDLSVKAMEELLVALFLTLALEKFRVSGTSVGSRSKVGLQRIGCVDIIIGGRLFVNIFDFDFDGHELRKDRFFENRRSKFYFSRLQTRPLSGFP